MEAADGNEQEVRRVRDGSGTPHQFGCTIALVPNPVTLKQIDKMADELAEKYGLSPQLTFAWLGDQKLPFKKFSQVTLSPIQVDKLIAFARI